MNDIVTKNNFRQVEYSKEKIYQYAEHVLQMEEVACKDWLTNKVDRSVTGRIAKQQCAGPLQLPVNNLGAIALDYRGKMEWPLHLDMLRQQVLLILLSGSILAIAEALTNIIWAPLTDKMRSISLSANWMWPCRNKGKTQGCIKL